MLWPAVHGPARMIQPAGHQESGEAAAETVTAVALDVGERWMPEPGGALPGHRNSSMPQRADVHGAIDKHPEIEPATRRERQRRNSSLRSIVENDAADTRKLTQIGVPSCRCALS